MAYSLRDEWTDGLRVNALNEYIACICVHRRSSYDLGECHGPNRIREDCRESHHWRVIKYIDAYIFNRNRHVLVARFSLGGPPDRATRSIVCRVAWPITGYRNRDYEIRFSSYTYIRVADFQIAVSALKNIVFVHIAVTPPWDYFICLSLPQSSQPMPCPRAGCKLTKLATSRIM